MVMQRHLILIACWMSLGLCTQSCVTASAVNQRIGEIRSILEPKHGPAVACAPRQLAYAEVYSQVALYETSRGDTVLANIHQEKATEFAREAFWRLNMVEKNAIWTPTLTVIWTLRMGAR